MKLTGLSTFLYALITIYLCPCVAPSFVNQTIDDQFGDSLTGLVPIFWPETASPWANETCGGCAIKPDVTQAFKGTYSAATYHPAMGSMGINMQFIGTAIYVFFTLPNFQGDGVTTLTSANFTVDGEAPVLFTHTADPTTTAFIYKALVFYQTNLSNTLHVLNITTMGNVSMFVNFDYAIYTHDDAVLASSSTTTSTSQKSSTSNTVQQSTTSNTTTTTSAKTPAGAIVGGIAGGIVIFVIVISLLVCWNRRGRYDALQKDSGNKGPLPLITSELNQGTNPSPAASYAPVHSKSPLIALQLADQTGYDSSYSSRGGVGPSRQKQLPMSLGNPNITDSVYAGIPRSGHEYHVSHQNTRKTTREEIRRERQEELDNRLRVLQQEMEQVTTRPGGSLMEQRSFGATGGEVDSSTSDIRAEIRLMREQIQLLREQQRSSWAQGLSDDPPPGYTREISP